MFNVEVLSLWFDQVGHRPSNPQIHHTRGEEANHYNTDVDRQNSSIATYAYMISEWLVFNANSAIYQLYHGENKLIFNEMKVRSTLY